MVTLKVAPHLNLLRSDNRYKKQIGDLICLRNIAYSMNSVAFIKEKLNFLMYSFHFFHTDVIFEFTPNRHKHNNLMYN